MAKYKINYNKLKEVIDTYKTNTLDIHKMTIKERERLDLDIHKKYLPNQKRMNKEFWAYQKYWRNHHKIKRKMNHKIKDCGLNFINDIMIS